MTRRQRLEEALARAEADLQSAVTMHAAAGTDRFIAGDTLDKARATCRSAHAALTELINAER